MAQIFGQKKNFECLKNQIWAKRGIEQKIGQKNTKMCQKKQNWDKQNVFFVI